MPQELARVEQVGPGTLEEARLERVPERAPARLLLVRMDLLAALVAELVVRAVQVVVVVAQAVQVRLAARVVLPGEEPGRSVPDRAEYSSYLVLSHQLARKEWLEPVLLVARAVPEARMADVAQAEVPPDSLAHWLESSALLLADQWVEEAH